MIRQPSPETTMNKRTWRSLILAVILLAAGLRLYGLDRMSLWGDEACMVYLCQESPGVIVEALASADRPDVDVAPPLYFLLLHGWMKILGTTIWAFRGFSVLFGVLTVFFIIKTAETLYSLNIALLAGLLAALNPFQIWYSQEGRMYTLASCLAAAALWSVAIIIRGRCKRAGWIGLIVSGVLLLYTQYYGALLLASLVLFLLIRIVVESQRRSTLIKGTATTIGIWIVAFAPWLPVLATDYRHAGAPGGFPLMFNWLQTPAFLFLKATLFGNQTFVMDHLWVYPVPLLICVAALILVVVNHWKRAELQMLFLAFFCPFLLVYGLSLLGMRVYKSHPFIIFHPAFLICLAVGMWQLKPRLVKPAIGVFLAGTFLVIYLLVLGGNYVKPPTAHVTNWIDSKGSDSAQVAVIPAFIPNPMPIVGDLLAFKYHSGDRFKTCYLTGDTALEVSSKIKRCARDANVTASGDIESAEEIFVVCQLNPEVQPYLTAIFKELDMRWNRKAAQEFPSHNRGFSMMVIQYEVNGV